MPRRRNDHETVPRIRYDIILALLLAIVVEAIRIYEEHFRQSLKGQIDALPLAWRLAGWLILDAAILAIAIAILLIIVGILKATGFPGIFLRGLMVAIRHGASTRWRYRVIGRQWARFVRKGRRPELMRIRAAIANEYANQEVSDLSGISDFDDRDWPPEARNRWAVDRQVVVESRPLIVTNFLRYAPLIEATLNGALRAKERGHAPLSRVLCVTATTMSLTQWLNYDVANAHPAWEKFLSLHEHIIDSRDYILARIILVRADNVAAAWPVQLRTKASLAADMRHLVWEKMTRQAAGNNPPLYKLAAVQPAEFKEFKGVWPELAIEPDNVKRDRSAYVILDSAKVAARPDVTETTWGGSGRFNALGSAYIDAFHSKRTGKNGRHAYYAVVDPGDYVPISDDPWPPHPTDFFYVGLATSRTGDDEFDELKDLECDGLLCVSARPDEELHTAYLSLVDSDHCPGIFPRIDEYVKDLLGKCDSLRTLLP